MLFINFVCLVYLLVLVNCYTISKSVQDEDSFKNANEPQNEISYGTPSSQYHEFDNIYNKVRRHYNQKAKKSASHALIGKDSTSFENSPTVNKNLNKWQRFINLGYKRNKKKPRLASRQTTVTRPLTNVYDYGIDYVTDDVTSLKSLYKRKLQENIVENVDQNSKDFALYSVQDISNVKTNDIETYLPEDLINKAFKDAKKRVEDDEIVQNESEAILIDNESKTDNLVNARSYYSDSEYVFHGTAEIEALLSDIKRKSLEYVTHETPSVATIIENAVTETTFMVSPLLYRDSFTSSYTTENPVFRVIEEKDPVPIGNVYETRYYKQSTHDESNIVVVTKPHHVDSRDIKSTAATMAKDLSDCISKMFHGIKNKIETKVSEASSTLKHAVTKPSNNLNKEFSKIVNGTTKSLLPEKTSTDKIVSENVKLKVNESSIKSSTHAARYEKGVTVTTKPTPITTPLLQTTVQIDNDYNMLNMYEELLSKTNNNKPISYFANPDAYENKNLNNAHVKKRQATVKPGETLSKRSMFELIDEEEIKTEPSTIAQDMYGNYSSTYTSPELSYDALTQKICYKDFINGYKHYLNYQRQKGKEDNFSNMVKFQAHMHHKVDDIGKYILDKIPEIPESSTRDKRFIDDPDVGDELATKSDDSWFKRHFYVLFDRGPQKKFHTSETVQLKRPEAASKYIPTMQAYTTISPSTMSMMEIRTKDSVEVRADDYNSFRVEKEVKKIDSDADSQEADALDKVDNMVKGLEKSVIDDAEGVASDEINPERLKTNQSSKFMNAMKNDMNHLLFKREYNRYKRRAHRPPDEVELDRSDDNNTADELRTVSYKPKKPRKVKNQKEIGCVKVNKVPEKNAKKQKQAKPGKKNSNHKFYHFMKGINIFKKKEQKNKNVKRHIDKRFNIFDKIRGLLQPASKNSSKEVEEVRTEKEETLKPPNYEKEENLKPPNYEKEETLKPPNYASSTIRNTVKDALQYIQSIQSEKLASKKLSSENNQNENIDHIVSDKINSGAANDDNLKTTDDQKVTDNYNNIYNNYSDEKNNFMPDSDLMANDVNNTEETNANENKDIVNKVINTLKNYSWPDINYNSPSIESLTKHIFDKHKYYLEKEFIHNPYRFEIDQEYNFEHDIEHDTASPKLQSHKTQTPKINGVIWVDSLNAGSVVTEGQNIRQEVTKITEKVVKQTLQNFNFTTPPAKHMDFNIIKEEIKNLPHLKPSIDDLNEELIKFYASSVRSEIPTTTEQSESKFDVFAHEIHWEEMFGFDKKNQKEPKKLEMKTDANEGTQEKNYNYYEVEPVDSLEESIHSKNKIADNTNTAAGANSASNNANTDNYKNKIMESSNAPLNKQGGDTSSGSNSILDTPSKLATTDANVALNKPSKIINDNSNVDLDQNNQDKATTTYKPSLKSAISISSRIIQDELSRRENANSAATSYLHNQRHAQSNAEKELFMHINNKKDNSKLNKPKMKKVQMFLDSEVTATVLPTNKPTLDSFELKKRLFYQMHTVCPVISIPNMKQIKPYNFNPYESYNPYKTKDMADFLARCSIADFTNKDLESENLFLSTDMPKEKPSKDDSTRENIINLKSKSNAQKRKNKVSKGKHNLAIMKNEYVDPNAAINDIIKNHRSIELLAAQVPDVFSKQHSAKREIGDQPDIYRELIDELAKTMGKRAYISTVTAKPVNEDSNYEDLTIAAHEDHIEKPTSMNYFNQPVNEVQNTITQNEGKEIEKYTIVDIDNDKAKRFIMSITTPTEAAESVTQNDKPMFKNNFFKKTHGKDSVKSEKNAKEVANNKNADKVLKQSKCLAFKTSKADANHKINDVKKKHKHNKSTTKKEVITEETFVDADVDGDIMVDTTLLAYDDDLNYVPEVTGIAKTITAKSKKEKNLYKTLPAQHFTTPLPMNSEAFDRFLSENNMDVKSVTEPLNTDIRLPPYPKLYTNDIPKKSTAKAKVSKVNKIDSDAKKTCKTLNKKNKQEQKETVRFTDNTDIDPDVYNFEKLVGNIGRSKREEKHNPTHKSVQAMTKRYNDDDETMNFNLFYGQPSREYTDSGDFFPSEYNIATDTIPNGLTVINLDEFQNTPLELDDVPEIVNRSASENNWLLDIDSYLEKKDINRDADELKENNAPVKDQFKNKIRNYSQNILDKINEYIDGSNKPITNLNAKEEERLPGYYFSKVLELDLSSKVLAANAKTPTMAPETKATKFKYRKSSKKGIAKSTKALIAADVSKTQKATTKRLNSLKHKSHPMRTKSRLIVPNDRINAQKNLTNEKTIESQKDITINKLLSPFDSPDDKHSKIKTDSEKVKDAPKKMCMNTVVKNKPLKTEKHGSNKNIADRSKTNNAKVDSTLASAIPFETTPDGREADLKEMQYQKIIKDFAETLKEIENGYSFSDEPELEEKAKTKSPHNQKLFAKPALNNKDKSQIEKKEHKKEDSELKNFQDLEALAADSNFTMTLFKNLNLLDKPILTKSYNTFEKPELSKNNINMYDKPELAKNINLFDKPALSKNLNLLDKPKKIKISSHHLKYEILYDESEPKFEVNGDLMGRLEKTKPQKKETTHKLHITPATTEQICSHRRMDLDYQQEEVFRVSPGTPNLLTSEPGKVSFVYNLDSIDVNKIRKNRMPTLKFLPAFEHRWHFFKSGSPPNHSDSPPTSPEDYGAVSTVKEFVSAVTSQSKMKYDWKKKLEQSNSKSKKTKHARDVRFMEEYLPAKLIGKFPHVGLFENYFKEMPEKKTTFHENYNFLKDIPEQKTTNYEISNFLKDKPEQTTVKHKIFDYFIKEYSQKHLPNQKTTIHSIIKEIPSLKPSHYKHPGNSATKHSVFKNFFKAVPSKKPKYYIEANTKKITELLYPMAVNQAGGDSENANNVAVCLRCKMPKPIDCSCQEVPCPCPVCKTKECPCPKCTESMCKCSECKTEGCRCKACLCVCEKVPEPCRPKPPPPPEEYIYVEPPNYEIMYEEPQKCDVCPPCPKCKECKSECKCESKEPECKCECKECKCECKECKCERKECKCKEPECKECKSKKPKCNCKCESCRSKKRKCVEEKSESRKKRKRNIEGANTYTAKDVAALEVIVDLLKSDEKVAPEEPTTVTYSPFRYSSRTTDLPTRAIQVHIALPYTTDLDNMKRSIANPFHIRKVFSAKLSSPVDVEYQVHAFQPTTATTETSSSTMLKPGVYLFVDNNGKYCLKPVSEEKIARNAFGTTTPAVTSLSTSMSKSTPNKARVSVMRDELVFSNDNHVTQPHLIKPRTVTAADTHMKYKNSSYKTKRAALSKNAGQLICDKRWKKEEDRRKIIEDRRKRFNLKKIFGQDDDRVCDCKCKANATMCQMCAASDSVVRELIFEIDNIANYMAEHCTEIQTFFKMNPSAGRKLRDTVHKIDQAMKNYYKRVKGKCKGRTCAQLNGLEKRRTVQPVFNGDMVKALQERLNALLDTVNGASKHNIRFHPLLLTESDRLVELIQDCTPGKIHKRESHKELKPVYALDNITVKLICKTTEKPQTDFDLVSYYKTVFLEAFTNDFTNEFTTDPEEVSISSSTVTEQSNTSKRSNLLSLFNKFRKIKGNKSYKITKTPLFTQTFELTRNVRQLDDNQLERPINTDPSGTLWEKYINQKRDLRSLKENETTKLEAIKEMLDLIFKLNKATTSESSPIAIQTKVNDNYGMTTSTFKTTSELNEFYHNEYEIIDNDMKELMKLLKGFPSSYHNNNESAQVTWNIPTMSLIEQKTTQIVKTNHMNSNNISSAETKTTLKVVENNTIKEDKTRTEDLFKHSRISITVPMSDNSGFTNSRMHSTEFGVSGHTGTTHRNIVKTKVPAKTTQTTTVTSESTGTESAGTESAAQVNIESKMTTPRSMAESSTKFPEGIVIITKDLSKPKLTAARKQSFGFSQKLIGEGNISDYLPFSEKNTVADINRKTTLTANNKFNEIFLSKTTNSNFNVPTSDMDYNIKTTDSGYTIDIPVLENNSKNVKNDKIKGTNSDYSFDIPLEEKLETSKNVEHKTSDNAYKFNAHNNLSNNEKVEFKKTDTSAGLTMEIPSCGNNYGHIPQEQSRPDQTKVETIFGEEYSDGMMNNKADEDIFHGEEGYKIKLPSKESKLENVKKVEHVSSENGYSFNIPIKVNNSNSIQNDVNTMIGSLNAADFTQATRAATLTTGTPYDAKYDADRPMLDSNYLLGSTTPSYFQALFLPNVSFDLVLATDSSRSERMSSTQATENNKVTARNAADGQKPRKNLLLSLMNFEIARISSEMNKFKHYVKKDKIPDDKKTKQTVTSPSSVTETNLITSIVVEPSSLEVKPAKENMGILERIAKRFGRKKKTLNTKVKSRSVLHSGIKNDLLYLLKKKLGRSTPILTVVSYPSTVSAMSETLDTNPAAVSSKNGEIEACRPPNLGPRCMCDLKATIDHVIEKHRTLAPRQFDNFVQNVKCSKYKLAPQTYVINIKKNNKRPRKNVNNNVKNVNSFDDYYNFFPKRDGDVSNQQRFDYQNVDWMRSKRSLKSFDEYNENVDGKDVDANDVDGNDVGDDVQSDDIGNLISDTADSFETFARDDQGIYRAKDTVKRVKRMLDLQELTRGLKNLINLSSDSDHAYAMIGDTVTMECKPKNRYRIPTRPPAGFKEKYTWTTEREHMMSLPNVEVRGTTVKIRNVDSRNHGVYNCSDGKTVNRSLTLSVIKMPSFNIITVAHYSTGKECHYNDLKTIGNRLAEKMTKVSCSTPDICTVRIDEPVCLKDRANGLSHLRAAVVMQPMNHSIKCSTQCRRDLQCSLALLCAGNVAPMVDIGVIVEENGYNRSYPVSNLSSKKMLVTHTLRRKDSNRHREYHRLVSSISPGDVDVVVSCPAGYYLKQDHKICVPCQINEFSVEGANVCNKCPKGTGTKDPGSGQCKRSHVRPRRYEWGSASLCCATVVAGCVVCGVGAACGVLVQCLRPVDAEQENTLLLTAKEEVSKRRSRSSTVGRCQKVSTQRHLSPSRVLLQRFFRPSPPCSSKVTGLTGMTDSQETKFGLWKEKNLPPPLPPIDFDL